MSFNVRQMDGDDGPDRWEHRKHLLAETVRLCNPAVLGTQEIFAEQAAFLRDQIPHLKSFGRGRFGDDRDKHNLILFDSTYLSLLDGGDLWFSRTPEIPGSSDWNIPRPRMLTWGRLRSAGGTEIVVLNTHLPYGRDAAEARRQAALIVLRVIAAFPAELPLFVTGDFNAPIDSEVYAMLTEDLRDAWKTAQSISGPEGTLNGFGKLPSEATTRRIDWILHRGSVETVEAETVTHSKDGRFPSDHYPITATFRIPYVTCS
jgi:endonuclease/exonuclease/phosphatase family metal-dependent hydrolase